MTAVRDLLWLALAIPATGALLIGLAGHRTTLRESMTFLSASLLFTVVLILASTVWGPQDGPDALRLVLAEPLPGLAISLSLEPLGLLFALIASGLWIINSLYSLAYLRANDEQHQTRFFVFFALSIASTMGIALAGNFFTLFLFYELLTLSTWPLVTHHSDAAAQRSGRIYLGILMGTSICLLLPALIAVWMVTGTTEFAEGGILANKLAPQWAWLLLAMCMFGIGKAALMPFHAWLPNAMVAPTPVSALLHAVAVVKAGVFSVVKLIVLLFCTAFLAQAGASEWLTVIAGFTILAASFIALRADNLKRRLAYSTVSQLSYVTMAASLLGPLAITGAVLHIAAHALGKITLFFAAGNIYTATHKTRVSELRGIGRQMPWTMGAFAIGALSMIGLPPTAGFVSKWYILSGAVTAGHWIAVGVIILSTLLNAAYFLPVLYDAFFSSPIETSNAADPSGHTEQVHGEAPLAMVIAITLTAGATIAMFFLADWPLSLARTLH